MRRAPETVVHPNLTAPTPATTEAAPDLAAARRAQLALLDTLDAQLDRLEEPR